VQALAFLLQWLAGLPFATLSMAAPPWWMAACGVAGGALLAMHLPRSVRALGLPLLLPVLLWQMPRPAAGEFELLAADIGQGNAVLVRTATHSLLYDTGPRYSLESDAGHRVLVPLLRAFGERLDMLVLSHRDIDHTGGAPAVLAMQPQAALLSSIEATHPLQALRPAQRCEAGQRWTWDGVSFEVLHPFDTDYRSFTRPNAVSCVLRIGNGRATVLLAGDIERLQEAALVARTADRTCAPTCCWCRTTAARHRRARRCSMRCARASRWSRRAIATASGTPPGGGRALHGAGRALGGKRALRRRALGQRAARRAGLRARAPRARYWHHRVP
jgi:competence protein ComEC